MTAAANSDGKLQIGIAFYDAELFLFRAGPEALVLNYTLTAENGLNEAGGIRPYEYFVLRGDGNVSPHTFVAREL